MLFSSGCRSDWYLKMKKWAECCSVSRSLPGQFDLICLREVIAVVFSVGVPDGSELCSAALNHEVNNGNLYTNGK